jgi:hypothetical protein
MAKPLSDHIPLGGFVHLAIERSGWNFLSMRIFPGGAGCKILRFTVAKSTNRSGVCSARELRFDDVGRAKDADTGGLFSPDP